MTTLEAWKAELVRQLHLYSPHSAPLLNDEELDKLYRAGCSPEEAYGLDSDVRNGFTLPQSIEAWAREGKDFDGEPEDSRDAALDSQGWSS